MTFPSLRITRPSLVRPCCMPFALPGKIGGDVGMKVGSCVEAGRFLLGCTTKSSNVGEVGVHATMPVVTARFRCSRFDHDMNKNNVIKCNHFLATARFHSEHNRLRPCIPAVGVRPWSFVLRHETLTAYLLFAIDRVSKRLYP